MISLSGNKLQTLSAKFFNNLDRFEANLFHLSLYNNNWQCNNCEMNWFFNKAEENIGIESGAAYCSQPRRTKLLTYDPRQESCFRSSSPEKCGVVTTKSSKNMSQIKENLSLKKSIEILQGDDPNPCSQLLCQNQAKCTIDQYNPSEAYCNCRSGFAGNFCQKLVGGHLSSNNNNGYISFDGIELFEKTIERSVPLEISLNINTVKGGGTLLYWNNNKKEHIALEIFAGRVRLSLKSPRAQTYTIYSHQIVDDGYQHSIKIRVLADNVTMTVDKHKPRIIPLNFEPLAKNDKQQQQSIKKNVLIQQDQPKLSNLYIGGLDAKTSSIATNLWQLRNVTSFSGCISDLKFGANQVDFSTADVKSNLKPCQVCQSCAPGGFCVGEKDCQCFSGYQGQSCHAFEVFKKKEITPNFSNNNLISASKPITKPKSSKQRQIVKLGQNPYNSQLLQTLNHGPNLISEKLQKCPGKRFKMKIEEVHNNVKCSSKKNFSTTVCSCRSTGPCCRASRQKTRRIKLFCENSTTRKVKRIKVMGCACRGTQCLGNRN